MKTESLQIKSNKELTEDILEMTLSCSEQDASKLRPGQFINIKLKELYLRRPISISHAGKAEITIVYKIVGQGTRLMSGCRSGEFLDVLFPLGNGFDTQRSGKAPLLIGGGMGAAPLYGLCKELKKQGKEPQVALGFASAREVFFMESFKRLGVPVHLTTADGTMGAKGFVTDVIAELKCDYFYACGPEPMLKAVHEILPLESEGEMSFEARMGCGFGACMGCSCRTITGSKRICKEGPVLNRREVLW